MQQVQYRRRFLLDLSRYMLRCARPARKVHLRPVPQWQQGIFMVDGRMLISADDGDADLDEPDTIYVADMRDGKSYATALV